MRTFSRLSVVVSHDSIDGGVMVEVSNGQSSFEVTSFALALSMLPQGSRVQVVARGAVGVQSIYTLAQVIRNSHVLVSLDLSQVSELSRGNANPFEGNAQLLMIRFPKNMRSIDPRAFADCTALEAVTVPASCTEIGAGAFAGCKSLESLAFADARGWRCAGGSGEADAAGLDDAAEAAELLREGAYAAHTLFKADGSTDAGGSAQTAATTRRALARATAAAAPAVSRACGAAL